MEAWQLSGQRSAQGANTLPAQFTDLRGVAKGKPLPLHELGNVSRRGAGSAGSPRRPIGSIAPQQGILGQGQGFG
ncbi:hypothetical protein [Thiomonas sp.]